MSHPSAASSSAASPGERKPGSSPAPTPPTDPAGAAGGGPPGPIAPDRGRRPQPCRRLHRGPWG
eukprot:15483746-Alexandrium_andersonii.AAC.1